MKYTSILEKITCLSKLVSGSIIYPIFLVVLLLLIGLFFVKKIKNKKVIVLMIVSYLILFIITIFNNYEALGKVFDSISTNLFTNIYFPSTYTYLFVLLVVDVVTVVSLLNVKTEKIYRIVNGICFFVMQFILVLIMEVVASDSVDIFSKKSMFSNSNLVVLLESSIGIFGLWLVVVMIVYLSSKITERIVIRNTDKELVNASVNLSNVLEIDAPNNTCLENEYNQDEYKKVNDIVVNNIRQDSSIDNNLEVSVIEDEFQVNNMESDKVDSTLLFDRLLNNGLPVIRKNENVILASENNNLENDKIIENPKEDSVMLVKHEVEEKSINNILEDTARESVRDSYTLNDYRIFNKMLNDIKEFNGSNVMEINPYLELRLKAKYTAEKYYLFRDMLNSEN